MVTADIYAENEHLREELDQRDVIVRNLRAELASGASAAISRVEAENTMLVGENERLEAQLSQLRHSQERLSNDLESAMERVKAYEHDADAFRVLRAAVLRLNSGAVSPTSDAPNDVNPDTARIRTESVCSASTASMPVSLTSPRVEERKQVTEAELVRLVERVDSIGAQARRERSARLAHESRLQLLLEGIREQQSILVGALPAKVRNEVEEDIAQSIEDSFLRCVDDGTMGSADKHDDDLINTSRQCQTGATGSSLLCSGRGLPTKERASMSEFSCSEHHSVSADNLSVGAHSLEHSIGHRVPVLETLAIVVESIATQCSVWEDKVKRLVQQARNSSHAQGIEPHLLQEFQKNFASAVMCSYEAALLENSRRDPSVIIKLTESNLSALATQVQGWGQNPSISCQPHNKFVLELLAKVIQLQSAINSNYANADGASPSSSPIDQRARRGSGHGPFGSEENSAIARSASWVAPARRLAGAEGCDEKLGTLENYSFPLSPRKLQGGRGSEHKRASEPIGGSASHAGGEDRGGVGSKPSGGFWRRNTAWFS